MTLAVVAALHDELRSLLAHLESPRVEMRGGRTLHLGRLAGQDVGAEMVRSGMAWAYRYRVGAGPYAKLQKAAQKDKRGLFAASETAMAPTVFRQFHGICHDPLN